MTAELEAMMEEDSGRGISTNPNDYLIPMVYILQPLSPQVLRDKPESFIEGAEPGHILLKNSLEDPIQADIWFQPCLAYSKWVEWVPRKQGGGFVASHDHDGSQVPPAILKAVPYRDPENPKVLRYKINGTNDLIETRYFVGYVLDADCSHAREYIIPFSSSGHQFAKFLNNVIRDRRLPSGNPAGMWSTMYHFVTKMMSNQAGEWYVFDFPGDVPQEEKARFVNQPQLVKGRALYDAFVQGRVKADYAAQNNEGGGGGGDRDGAM